MKMALGLLIAAQLLNVPTSMANIANYDEPENEMIFEEEGPTRQEQFKWYYRMYNGHEQKRLWSITYARWVTEWMDV